MKRSYFQTHSCAGYVATVTIEWSHPDKGYNGEHVDNAEDVVEVLIGQAGPMMREIVQTMRGRR